MGKEEGKEEEEEEEERVVWLGVIRQWREVGYS